MTRSAVLPLALALVTALSLGACKRSEDTNAGTGSGTTSSTTGSSTSSMAASSPASAASQ